MLIKVDPLNGEPNDCGKCPVARAIVEQVADVEEVDVDGESVGIRLVCAPMIRYPLPANVQAFIALIDDGKAREVGEFSFDLPFDP